VIHYASREALDIEGLGTKRAEQLIQAGLIERLSDLYALTPEDLVSLERFGEKSARNLIDEIKESREATLARFLYGLGIPQVGSHIAEVLAQHVDTLDELVSASKDELVEIDEIGLKIARSVVAFFADDQNRQIIADILEAGLQLSNPYAEDRGCPLEGLTFVFTGELDRWTRDEVKRRVERLGGRATSSVSGETDYVVAGPGAGSKLDEARERGVPVMDEHEFIQLIEERGGCQNSQK
jgi:DNA ligase (NAD+)